MQDHFRFSHSISQQLGSTFFALLIPGLLALALSITKPFPSPTKMIAQSRLLFISAPRSITAPANTATLTARKKQLISEKSNSIKPKTASEKNQLPAPSIAETISSSSVRIDHDMDLMQDTNQASHVERATLTTHAKSKAVWAAYQDSHSDIQKMASRKGIALHATRLNKYDEFQNAAENAVIPGCLEKGTSSKLGLDSLKGLLIIPALTVSALRGKCK
ncbi:hypothetical protein [Undibacterium flavidum]|uniref:Uncharacterized protein n=1 Tax=Undibacterium flavidum TaxID=2762297 RepID=A0ABR6YHK9_9BURK|nr:hypothetical protein [Undibacterium flavidum]MBC3876026.1 hypothetical protein [Undibacterium flavidum]